jgi:proton glutamate symport protein
VHLSLCGQVLMMLTLMITSKGFAGVPRSALVLLFATAATFHLPTEPIFVVLGIDAVADMGRTAINVIGNCLASVIVAKWEGVFGEEHASTIVLEAMAD